MIGFDRVDAERARHLRVMPTRLSPDREDIDLAVGAGREATWKGAALQRYVQRRQQGRAP